MKKALKAGVIGLGVGEQHIIGYKSIPNVEVTDICDLDLEKLRLIGSRHGVSGLHNDYRGITENPDIDVVSIASHDNFHTEQAVSAFQNGKHVMVEKPVALNRTDAERLLRAQQDSGKIITSNLILRRSPRFIELKNWIQKGDLGKIVAIDGDYIHQILHKLTQGWRGQMEFYCVTYGGGIHLIDLMRWLLDQEVTEVCGMGNKILTHNSNYKFDDVIVNLLRFEEGTIGKTMSNFGPQRSHIHAISVYGTKKTFVNDIPNAKIFNGDRPENETIIHTPYPAINKHDLLPDFIDAIRESRESSVTSVDVFRVMDICLACFDSLQAKRTVPVSYLI